MGKEIQLEKKPLVLIVDDNPSNIQIVGNHLIQENLSIAMAVDGQKAINTAKLIKPDLILLDIMMPEIDGFQVAKELKSDPDTKDIPIIFLTAKTATEDIVKGFTLGAVDYIVKPFNSSELLVRVHTHLELKRIRELLVLKNSQLEAVNNEKNELLGIAAHDLKNPIYNISMLAKVILEEELDKEEIQEFATDIVNTSERMLELIKNLLDINAIEQGKIAIHLENTDIDELTHATVDSYFERANAKQIKLYYDNKLSNNFVFADRNALLQILDNLISNAVKYSPYEKNIYISLYDSNDKSVLSVKDEGPGLSDSDKTKLFGKFARLSAQPTGGEHSTGLGLSIVKRYVENSGGSIEVVSELGKGCNFIVGFPKAYIEEA